MALVTIHHLGRNAHDASGSRLVSCAAYAKALGVATSQVKSGPRRLDRRDFGGTARNMGYGRKPNLFGVG
jgi:hypothetical protein